MLSTVQLNHSNHIQDMVPENSFSKINNFRNDDHGPYSNPQQEDCTPYDANFEIANRAFYATINKFTRQACPDTSTRRRSAPYSFLENWHLHSIYSKSQQTLLGITPVKPSVLLSGDDFMFTPPFIQEEDEEEEEEEEEEEFYSDEDEEDDNQGNWDFYHLSPCPETNQAGELFSCSSYPPSSTAAATTAPISYFETTPLYPHTIATTTKQDFYDQQETQGGNIWIENDERRPFNLNGFQSLSNLNLLTIQIPHQNKTLDSPLSPEEESSSSSSSASSSSSDEQLLNSYSPSDSDSVCSSITSEKLDAFFNTTDNFENDADIDDVDDRKQLSPQQQELSSYDLMNLYDTTFPTSEELNRQQDVAQIPAMNSPVTRSSSFKSQNSIESVVSYQSLADLMHPQQPSACSSFYGSISHSFTFDGNMESGSKKSILNSIVDTLVNNNNNAKDHDALNNEEMGTRPATNECGTALNTIWTSLAIFIMYCWRLLIQFFTRKPSTSLSSNESESLL